MKRRRLGQHYLISGETARLIVDSASIRQTDRVIEIGTGQGVLTKLISPLAREVVTYEIDRHLAENVRKHLSNLGNVRLVLGDAFEVITPHDCFDIWITSLPYSRSLDFIELLSTHSGRFRSAVAVLQSEFTSKLLARPGTPNYRAVSVMAQASFVLEKIASVPSSAFWPIPKVFSTVLRLTPLMEANLPFFTKPRIRLLKKIFSFRGRLLRSALREMGLEFDPLDKIDPALLERRVEKLRPEELAGIIREEIK